MVVRTSGTSRAPQTGPSTFQAYVDGIPVPAAVLDDRGRIEAINRAWEEGARPGGLVAPSDHMGVDHVRALREKGFQRDAGRGLAQRIEAVAAGHRRSAQYEYDIRSDDATTRWEATVTALELEGQRVVLLVHRDRTAEQREGHVGQRVAQLLLEREKHTAIERDRQRLLQAGEQSFHAPMTPIRLQLHLLRSGSLGRLTQRQQASLERIDRNVHRWWNLQTAFISDLMALEDPDHQPEAVDATHLLEEAMQPFSERALKAGVRLRIDRSQGPLHVHVDRRGVVQVMMLLLDHAIRQTPAGGLVWVRLRSVGRHAELVIQDQDPVIAPEQLHALLAPDGRETGLRTGILHARSVLARDHGWLTVRCPGPGQGLEATISLPLG